MKNIIDMSHEALVTEFEEACKNLCFVSTISDKNIVRKAKLKREILRRMLSYNFAVNPLNKKLYKKVVVKA